MHKMCLPLRGGWFNQEVDAPSTNHQHPSRTITNYQPIAKYQTPKLLLPPVLLLLLPPVPLLTTPSNKAQGHQAGDGSLGTSNCTLHGMQCHCVEYVWVSYSRCIQDGLRLQSAGSTCHPQHPLIRVPWTCIGCVLCRCLRCSQCEHMQAM